MNRPVTSADRRRALDRLVDGELNARERKQLLAELDNDPQGWRQCGLAFLEAQAWRTEMPALVAASAGAERGGPPPAPDRPAQPSGRPIIALTRGRFALAAAVLIAFSLGWLVRGDGQPVADPGGGRLAVRHRAAGEPGRSAPLADAAKPAEVPGELVELALGSADDAASHEMVLPLIDREELERRWQPGPLQAIPDALAKWFGQSGHEIMSVRELRPVRLDDGRPALLPIDRLQVRYVADEYQ